MKTSLDIDIRTQSLSKEIQELQSILDALKKRKVPRKIKKKEDKAEVSTTKDGLQSEIDALKEQKDQLQVEKEQVMKDLELVINEVEDQMDRMTATGKLLFNSAMKRLFEIQRDATAIYNDKTIDKATREKKLEELIEEFNQLQGYCDDFRSEYFYDYGKFYIKRNL